MTFRADLDRICREHRLLSLYLFGSRAEDGLKILAGEKADREGSDLDIGAVFAADDLMEPEFDFWSLSRLQVDLEDLFAPLHVDLVPLQKVDALFQFRAFSGHRIAETQPTRNAYYELAVMRLASELLPIQRELEREQFGWSST